MVGKWQVVESFYSIGNGEQLSRLVEDGSIIQLKSNGKFETNLVKSGKDGSYEIKGDSLILKFSGAINPSEYIYRFAVNNETLDIKPISPYICTEGCHERFKKVD